MHAVQDLDRTAVRELKLREEMGRSNRRTLSSAWRRWTSCFVYTQHPWRQEDAANNSDTHSIFWRFGFISHFCMYVYFCMEAFRNGGIDSQKYQRSTLGVVYIEVAYMSLGLIFGIPPSNEQLHLHLKPEMAPMSPSSVNLSGRLMGSKCRPTSNCHK